LRTNEKREGRHATPRKLPHGKKFDPIIINRESHLFLGGGLLSLGLSPLLPDPDQTSLASGLAQPPVSSLLTLWHFVTLDLTDSFLAADVLDGQDSVEVSSVTLGLAGREGSLGSINLLSGRVELLELAALAGEQNQASLVFLETGNVGGERLLGVVDATGINSNTDGWGELAGDTGFLQIRKMA